MGVTSGDGTRGSDCCLLFAAIQAQQYPTLHCGPMKCCPTLQATTAKTTKAKMEKMTTAAT